MSGRFRNCATEVAALARIVLRPQTGKVKPIAVADQDGASELAVESQSARRRTQLCAFTSALIARPSLEWPSGDVMTNMN